MHPTLLLNASFEPLKVISWKRAIILMVTGKVEVIESYNQQVRSVSIAYRLPSVLRLLSFVSLRYHVQSIRFSRTNLFIRDQFSCQYCGIEEASTRLTLDHVIPVAYGGKRDWYNMVTACRPCNQEKGGRTPSQARKKLLRNPTKPSWTYALSFSVTLKDPPDIWKAYLELAPV